MLLEILSSLLAFLIVLTFGLTTFYLVGDALVVVLGVGLAVGAGSFDDFFCKFVDFGGTALLFLSTGVASTRLLLPKILRTFVVPVFVRID